MVVKLRMSSPKGWDKAKCSQVDISAEYDPFFSEDKDDITDAVDFCNGIHDDRICPIRENCMLFALVNNEKDGVWGGTTDAQRRIIRKQYPPKRGGKPREEWKLIHQERESQLPREEE
jgi:Transcription factor WhiB